MVKEEWFLANTGSVNMIDNSMEEVLTYQRKEKKLVHAKALLTYEWKAVIGFIIEALFIMFNKRYIVGNMDL